jgi:chemotaxis methyl-accepting protein methylase
MNSVKLLSQSELKELREFLKKNCGIDILDYRENFLSRRFLVRANSLGFDDLSSYLNFIKKDEKEREFAKKRLFIPTTEFFRNRDVFEKIKEILSNDKTLKKKRFVTLSSPCSSGEEPLSLAMMLSSLFDDFIVIAMDRNLSILKEIKNKKLSQKLISPLYKNEIKSYLKEVGNAFSFKEEVLNKILFSCSDLLQTIPAKGIDLVLIRNFFIYLKEEAQMKCVSNLKKCLKKGSLMVLGKVERIKLNKDEWDVVDINSRIYRFKGSKE